MYSYPNFSLEHQSTLRQLSEASFNNIRVVATDMDGTLTTRSKFSGRLLQALENLAAGGIKVLIVTGRSAGWMSALSHLMPIIGAIAENGGLFYPSGYDQPVTLTPIPDLEAHRRSLGLAFAELKQKFPQIQESADNRFRVTDWTFDVAGLSLDELKILNNLCQEMGWGFTYSNVQCHIKPQEQNKAVGLLEVLRGYLPEFSLEQVLTVGDSPNDESLFDPEYFSVSVGVANVRKYVNQLEHQPTYMTTAAEGEGFCELCDYILQSVEIQPKI
ncbi:HAD-IIB family hydrolase [Umezakia ovalisporum]|uniref:HAD-IIB family hydrolase n=1 Tax=Umezakia ovalisporum TaxID=75695 RepID=UPI0035B77EB4